MTEDEPKTDFFDQLQWPTDAILKSYEIWPQNEALVKALCEAADSVEWQNGQPGEGTYTHMPRIYHVSGSAPIEYLPHWGRVKVGGVELKASTPVDQILKVAKVRRSWFGKLTSFNPIR